MNVACLFSRLDASLSISSAPRRSISSAPPRSGSSTVPSVGSGGGGLRICGLSDLKDNFLYGMKKDEVESVLSKIRKIYDLAKLDVSLRRGCCSCLGLLDPVTNIRFNFIVAGFPAPAPAPAPADGGGGQGAEEDMMARRSLDGLIAFLTCLFPYLPDAEALAYIDAAAADPLVAAFLIIDRRALTIDSFITGTSVEIALRSAAAAAKHPDPEGFIRGWKLASLGPEEVATKLQSHKVGIAALSQLYGVLLCGTSIDLELQGSLELAKGRLPSGRTRRALYRGQLPSARGAIKRIILSMIHGYYLKALATLPKQELTSIYHRSLLIGGHCYGPLDPISNIIVNTIWYEQCFPAREIKQIDMISTSCLWRMAARSLYGLVSFLCTRKKDLTLDQALQCLLVARAHLTLADPEELKDHDGKKTGRRGATVLQAYSAAAQSAKHPRPMSQAEFLTTPASVRNLHTFSETLLSVDGVRTLTKERFNCLLTMFRSPSTCMLNPQQEGRPTQLGRRVYFKACEAQNSFWLKHERVKSKVEAALHKFNATAVHKYSLHVICGVNELVDGEFSLDPEVKAYNPWTPRKYHYSHINFLATSEGSDDPKLFFAECSNHGTNTSWCVPIVLHPDAGISVEGRPNVGMRPEAARCIYCEREEGRIWHPIAERFHGRDDFEKFDGVYHTNNGLIQNARLVDWVDGLSDDTIYANICAGPGPGHTISNGKVHYDVFKL